MAEQLPTREEPRGIAQARRDAGLRKTSRLTAWLLAGSVALTGVLSAVAAQAVPGHAKRVERASTARKSASSPSTSSSTNPSAATDSSTLQAPAQTPAPSRSSSSGSGGSVSGGS